MPTYRVLLATVAVGNVTPIPLYIEFQVSVWALPASLMRKINGWPFTGVPEGTAIVAAVAWAVTA